MIKKVLVTRKELVSLALGVVELVLDKNEKYRDSWQKHGVFTPLIRMTEKGVRLDENANKPVLIIDESEDAIINNLDDIIGYALLAKLWLKYNKQYPEPNEWQMEFEDIAENWLESKEGSVAELGISPISINIDEFNKLKELYISSIARVFGISAEELDLTAFTVEFLGSKEGSIADVMDASEQDATKAADFLDTIPENISFILDRHSKRVKDSDGNPI